MERPWLQHYPPGLPACLEYPDHPLHRYLSDSAQRFPQRTALLEFDGENGKELSTRSYLQLDSQSEYLASALRHLGVGKGDRVAYFTQNSPELVVTFYGVLKAGAVAVPCNPMYRAEELSHQLVDSGASVIICDPELHPLVTQVRSSTAVKTVIVAGASEAPPGCLSFAALVESEGKTEVESVSVTGDDLALLCYTGGTTGVPKGAMLSHRNLVVNAHQFSRWFGYHQGKEVFIAALPLFHIGGIAGVMSVPIAVGGTIILFRRFHPRGVLEAIQHYRATRFLGVPTMYISILEQDSNSGYDFSSLQPSRTGAAPLPPPVKEAFDELVGHEVLVEGYGLTETSPLTHVNPPQRARAGSIGLPLPDTDALVVDPDQEAEALPTGEVGELLIKGPQVMRGYWNKPDATAEVLADGWLHTGDLAYMDSEGYFHIVDRKKDVINAAGFKVWPREVEDVLYRHPQVRMVAVIGEPDPYRGETVKACIVLKEGHHLPSMEAATEELTAFCRQHLAAYKVPRVMEFRDSLPVSAAGKILRRGLRGQ